MTKVGVISLILVLVSVECAHAWLWIPCIDNIRKAGVVLYFANVKMV